MSYVYIIQADNGEVKIGVSDAPFHRLNQVKREYGPRRGFRDAYLVGCLRTSRPVTVEATVLDLLDPYSVGGEWFRVSSLYALRALLFSAEGFTDGFVVMEGPTQPRPPVGKLRSLLA